MIQRAPVSKSLPCGLAPASRFPANAPFFPRRIGAQNYGIVTPAAIIPALRDSQDPREQMGRGGSLAAESAKARVLQLVSCLGRKFELRPTRRYRDRLRRANAT